MTTSSLGSPSPRRSPVPVLSTPDHRARASPVLSLPSADHIQMLDSILGGEPQIMAPARFPRARIVVLIACYSPSCAPNVFLPTRKRACRTGFPSRSSRADERRTPGLTAANEAEARGGAARNVDSFARRPTASGGCACRYCARSVVAVQP